MNITDPIRRAARINPEAIALVDADGTRFSYIALDRAIDRAGAFALTLGLRPGDIVGRAIAPPHQALGLVMSLGLARVGVAAAPASLPDHHLQLRLHAGGPVPPGSIAYHPVLLTDVGNTQEVPMAQGGDALCLIASTSGTAGRVKHIPLSHALLTRRVQAIWLGDGGGPTTRLFGTGLEAATTFHNVLRTLWAGGAVVLATTDGINAAISRHGVRALRVSPLDLAAILESRPEETPPEERLECIEIAGGRLPPPLHLLTVERLCANIVNAVGSSEAGEIASAPLHRMPAHADAAGYIHAGVEVQALDDEGVPLPAGRQGLLRIRNDMLAPGYFDDLAATAAAFRDGWFISDDIGTVWPDGSLSLAGRLSDVINSGGVKLDPSVIEAAMMAIPTVIDAAAFGVPDERGLEQIWIAFVARGATADAALEAACRPLMPHIARAGFIRMQALPRNANGKIDRAALAAVVPQARTSQGAG